MLALQITFEKDARILTESYATTVVKGMRKNQEVQVAQKVRICICFIKQKNPASL